MRSWEASNSSNLRFGQTRFQIFFSFQSAFENFPRLQKTVNNCSLFTSCLKTATGSFLQFFSKQHPVPKKAKPSRNLENQ